MESSEDAAMLRRDTAGIWTTGSLDPTFPEAPRLRSIPVTLQSMAYVSASAGCCSAVTDGAGTSTVCLSEACRTALSWYPVTLNPASCMVTQLWRKGATDPAENMHDEHRPWHAYRTTSSHMAPIPHGVLQPSPYTLWNPAIPRVWLIGACGDDTMKVSGRAR